MLLVNERAIMSYIKATSIGDGASIRGEKYRLRLLPYSNAGDDNGELLLIIC